MERDNILEVKNLKKYFPVRRGILLREVGKIKAVDRVSFGIKRGTTYGLVGESGSGKSTLARVILKLIPPDGGKIIFNNSDVTELNENKLKFYRKKVQIVFQDPLNSLDPRYKVKDILKEAIFLLRGKLKSKKIEKEIDDLLNMVNVPVSLKENFPHQISGGQAQRVCIARALCGKPELVVLDEPTSGVDVTTASKLLKLLLKLQRKLNISYLFISHDLKTVRKVSDIIGVMLNGKIVEESIPNRLFTNPAHPYTKKLLRACLFR